MTEETRKREMSRRTKAIIVIGAMVIGLALAPGYLLLCGNSSGKQVGEYELYRAGESNNAFDKASIDITLTREMGNIGLNVIIETPFRDHTKAEAARFQSSLLQTGHEVPLWEGNFALGHGRKREAIAGTTFTIRARSFRVDQDGKYIFELATEPALDNIRSIRLQVRSNVMLPNRWILGLGLFVIAGVIVWALIPIKGYDHKAERTGTKWYED
jgi:hypothetical protein